MQLGLTYNNNEFAPPNKPVVVSPTVVADKVQKAGDLNEDRHPQDKVLEYLKDGVPTEDEFCTPNSSIKNLDNYFIGKRIG